jgi:phage anti-repressor protein
MKQQDKQEVLITAKDLHYIISSAVKQFTQLPNEIYISNKKVDEKDFSKIAIANSMILWFNQKNLLNKTVSFDFTDKSLEFDEIGD